MGRHSTEDIAPGSNLDTPNILTNEILSQSAPNSLALLPKNHVSCKEKDWVVPKKETALVFILLGTS